MCDYTLPITYSRICTTIFYKYSTYILHIYIQERRLLDKNEKISEFDFFNCKEQKNSKIWIISIILILIIKFYWMKFDNICWQVAIFVGNYCSTSKEVNRLVWKCTRKMLFFYCLEFSVFPWHQCRLKDCLCSAGVIYWCQFHVSY